MHPHSDLLARILPKEEISAIEGTASEFKASARVESMHHNPVCMAICSGKENLLQETEYAGRNPDRNIRSRLPGSGPFPEN